MQCQLFADMNPEEVSNWIAAVLVGSCILAVLAKCIQVMRRPSVNTLCMLSLTLMVGLPLLLVLLDRAGPSQLLDFVSAIILFALPLAALATGVLGVKDYNRNLGKYEQGWGQGMWGIVLSLCALGFVAYNFAIGTMGAAKVAETEPEQSALDTIRFEKFRLFYKMMDPRWKKWEPESENEVTAQVIYVRQEPEVFFVVHAEWFGDKKEEPTKIGANNELGVEVFQSFFRDAASFTKFETSAPETVNGIDGLRYEATGTMQGYSVRQSCWVAVHNDVVYYMVASCDKKDSYALPEIARKLRQGFRVLDIEGGSDN